MSVKLMESVGVDITRYVGPVGAEHETRKRFQITNVITGEYVTLSWAQLIEIRQWLGDTSEHTLALGDDIDG